MTDRTCSVDGCERKHGARGWCSLHYMRWYRYSDPLATLAGLDLPLLDRLAAKSIQQGECIVWTGNTNEKGYGRIWLAERRMEYTHRAAWIARHGPIPPETPCVLHHCDNPPCWRDEHLWLGTIEDNNRDMVIKGRDGGTKKTHCPHGHLIDTVRPSGVRVCGTCARAAGRASYRKRRRRNVTHQHMKPAICDVCELWPPHIRQITAHLNRLEDILEQHRLVLAQHSTFLNRIDRKLTTVTENQQAADAVQAQLGKALGEIRGLIDGLNASIVDLQAQVAAGGTVDLSGVQAAAQQLDDLVPDAPPAEPA